MAVAAPPPLLPDAPTATDAVFEKLIADIVSGVYPAGSRLPAERELSRLLGASRPTLREGLRKLNEWNLVEPRRGSGVVVLPYRDWSFEVIGAYLRYGKPDANQPTVARMLVDMFAMRRVVMLEVIRLIAPRIRPGGTTLARAAMARAWQVREQPEYPREDFEVLRRLCEAAQFTPGLWMLNRVSAMWMDAAAALRFAIRAPDDYVAAHTHFFDLLESGAHDAARAHMAAYLDRHDDKLTAALGFSAASETTP